MLAYTSVKVAYVNPPKPGKKMGSIKDESGNYYGVWPDKLGQFSVGGTYNIEYETGTFNGRETRTLKRVLDVPGAPTPNASRPGSASPTARPSDAKAREMFVMAVVGKALQGAGTVPDTSTLASWVAAAALGWDLGMRDASSPKKAEPAPIDQEALDDEIPF